MRAGTAVPRVSHAPHAPTAHVIVSLACGLQSRVGPSGLHTSRAPSVIDDPAVVLTGGLGAGRRQPCAVCQAA